MPVPPLPAELIADIFSKLVEAEKVQERDVKIMADLCLVSRLYLPFARRQLYRAASIQFVPLARTPGLDVHDEDNNDEGPVEPTTGSRLLAATLASSPHLARLVNVFCLDLGGRTGDNGADMVRKILKSCTGINEMEISEYWDVGLGTGALGDALRDGGSRIRIFHASNGVIQEGSALGVAISRLQLDELHLTNHTATFQCEVVYPSPSSHLRSLSYIWVNLLSFDSVVASSHHSLRRLHSMARGDPFDLSPFTGLETVRYECHKATGATLESLPSSLTTLHLYSTGWKMAGSTKDTVLEQLEERRVLHSLPPSLLHLNARHMFFSPEYILDLVASPSVCPSLRTLAIPLSSIFQRVAAELSHDDENPMQVYRDIRAGVRSEEELEKLGDIMAEAEGFVEKVEERCAGRGIRVLQ
jgi:hypothetical protein